MNIIKSLSELKENLKTFDGYRKSKNATEREVHANFVKRGIVFVAYNSRGKRVFAPSRFIGYKNNTIRKHARNSEKDGKITTPEIEGLLGARARESSTLEREYKKFCKELGFIPWKKGSFGVSRKYLEIE